MRGLKLSRLSETSSWVRKRVIEDLNYYAREVWSKGERRFFFDRFQAEFDQLMEEITKPEYIVKSISLEEAFIGITAYKLENQGIKMPLFYVCHPFRGKGYEHLAMLQLIDGFKSLPRVEGIEILLHPFCRFIDDDRFFRSIGFEVQEWVWMSKSLERSERITPCSPEIECEIMSLDEELIPDIARLDIEARILLESRGNDFDTGVSKICFRDGKIIGFVLISTSGSEGVVEYLFVSQEFRRRGVGQALLKASLKQLQDKGIKSVVAEVNVGNSASISLLRSLDFSLCCRAHLIAEIREISNSRKQRAA